MLLQDKRSLITIPPCFKQLRNKNTSKQKPNTHRTYTIWNISGAVIAYGTWINIFLRLTMLPQPKFQVINRKLRAWWDVLSGEALVELFILYKSSSRTTLRRRDVLVTRVGSLMWLLFWIRIDLPWQPSTPRALVAPGVMTFLVSTSTGYVVTFQTILYACVHMWLMRVFFLFFIK